MKEVKEHISFKMSDIEHKLSEEESLRRRLGKNQISYHSSNHHISREEYMKVPVVDDGDQVIFQGELLKLKPGIKFEHQNRWV